jgi:hypothetical protein
MAKLLGHVNPEEDILMAEDIWDDIFDEADAFNKVEHGATRRLSSLVRQLRGIEGNIEDMENSLKALKQEKHKLSTELIPQLMVEMGVERIDVDGVRVIRKLLVSASIPEERRDEAFSWLRENGLDDIIKNDVVLSFGKGEDNLAGHAVGLLEESGFTPTVKTHVHPMTLKAFVRERVEGGQPLDLDMFGAFITNAAEIKRK